MNALPEAISEFLKQKDIVSFATHNGQDFWAANCFYAFDQQNARLIIMSKRSTRHGQIMLENPHIVGTISCQSHKIKEMEGIQFSAQANLLEQAEARKAAFKIYTQKQPLAKLLNSDIWEICLNEIKFVSNKSIFSNKIHWLRDKES